MTGDWSYGDVPVHVGAVAEAALEAAAWTGASYLALAHLIRPDAGRGQDQRLVRLTVVALRDRYIIHTAEYQAAEFDGREASILLEQGGYETDFWEDCEVDCWTALAVPEQCESW